MTTFEHLILRGMWLILRSMVWYLPPEIEAAREKWRADVVAELGRDEELP